jgi:2-octaprenyl-6-methoxyphenol hydroxylase
VVNNATPAENSAMPDVLIVGAGPVGAVCALALQQQGIAARVLEAQPVDARADSRTLALSHGSQLILDRLGVWSALENVTPITRIHISQRGALGVARLSAEDVNVPALGYVLPYATLTAALKQALAGAKIAVEYGVAVNRIESDAAAATLHTGDGRSHTAPLVIVADGGRGDPASKVGTAPEPKLQRDYEQMAVVCEVQTELPHANQAYERFTPEGPAALLPKGDRYALVWTASHADAERIAAMGDAEFLAPGTVCRCQPAQNFPLETGVCRQRSRRPRGAHRQRRADAASGVGAGLQHRPARRLGTGEPVWRYCTRRIGQRRHVAYLRARPPCRCAGRGRLH